MAGQVVIELSMPEAALALGRTWHAAYGLLLSGKIKGRREGKRWLVDAESVERFRATEQAGGGADHSEAA